MLPALILLVGGAAAYAVYRNKEDAKVLADQAVRSMFQGKRELEAMVGQMLDGTPEPGEDAEAWVNVDSARTDYLIHAPGCRYVEAKTATEFHGVGELLRDGGWMPFASLEEAQEAYPTALQAKDGCWGSAADAS